jgi:hypothetical protein
MIAQRIGRGISMRDAAMEANIASEDLGRLTDVAVLSLWHAHEARAWTPWPVSGSQRSARSSSRA